MEDIDQECMELPPGFRFHPTDEEIITHYLSPKVLDNSFSARAVGEVDLNKCEPWDLPSMARMGENEWYFFCQRDRKYPTGTRTNRATEAGYWKATGKDREIYRRRSPGAALVGMKKTLVFYRGRAPRGQKSNWVMHEYRLQGKSPNSPNSPDQDDLWVVCRVFRKIGSLRPSGSGQTVNYSLADEYFFDSTTLPPLMEPPHHHDPNSSTGSSSFLSSSNSGKSFDGFREIDPIIADQHAAAMNYDRLSSIDYKYSSSYGSLLGNTAEGYLHRERPEAMLRALAAHPNAHDNSAIRSMHCKMEPRSDQSPIINDDRYCSTEEEIPSMAAKPYDFVDPSSSVEWENWCKY